MFRYLNKKSRNILVNVEIASVLENIEDNDAFEDLESITANFNDMQLTMAVSGENISAADIGLSRRNNERKCLKNQLNFVNETWQILRKRRANNARFLLIALLILFFLGSSISMGIMSLQYLYIIKTISINQVEYGYFKALNTLFRALALLFLLPLFKRCFSAPDYILFILGFTSEFLNLVVFSLAHFFKYVIWLGNFILFFFHLLSHLLSLHL